MFHLDPHSVSEALSVCVCVRTRVADESSSDSECDSDGDSSCSSSSDSEVFDVIAEIKRKKAHPDRLHDELWYNDPGQVRTRPPTVFLYTLRRTFIHLKMTTNE